MPPSTDSSSSRSDNLLSPVSSSGSKLVRSVSGSSNRSSLRFKPPHKHNDYACYIQLLNRTDCTLRLVDAKALSGHWAGGTPPKEIEPHTDVVIELADPKGPHGSEGWCAYRLDHPGRAKPVSFRLKFADPYWGGDENYLHATTQYPEWVALNVLDYVTSGHPFTAYVEVRTLQGERRTSEKQAEDSARPRSSDAVSTDSSSGSLPSYDDVRDAPYEPSKEPVQIIQPVDIEVDQSSSDDEGRERPTELTTDKEAENVEQGGQKDIKVEDEVAQGGKKAIMVEDEMKQPVQEETKTEDEGVQPDPEEILVEDDTKQDIVKTEPVTDSTVEPSPSEAAAPEIPSVSEPSTNPKEQSSEDMTKGEAAERPKEEVEADDLKDADDLNDDYVEVEKDDTGDVDSGDAVTQPEVGYWWELLQSHHGKIGIAALLFLACYGVTAVRISRGLMSRGAK